MVGHFKTNFSRGQVSAKVETRIDAQSYADGARVAENVLVFLQGGARARPGSKHIDLMESGGTPYATTNGARLEPWIVDRDEAYILCFTATGIVDIYRVTASGASLVDTDSSQDWTGDALYAMTVKPVGNYVFIADQTFRTTVITRTGLDTFTYTYLDFDTSIDGDQSFEPFFKYASTGTTLTLSDWDVGTGVTVTASSALFDDDHVGRNFKVRDGEFTLTSRSSTTVGTCEITRKVQEVLDPNPFATHDGTTNITCTWVNHGLAVGNVVNFDGTGDNSAAGITGSTHIDGNRTVTQVLDRDRFTFASGVSATETVDFGGSSVYVRSASATENWKEPAFSNIRGWPQAVEVHESRLWLAGPAAAGSARFASKVGNFFSFDVGENEASDSLALASAIGGNIRHMVSGDDLEIYTDVWEAYMPSGFDEPITPSNAREKRQTKFGSSYTQPQRFDGSTLFVDAVGSHVREFYFDGQNSEVYVSSPVTALANDIINQPKHSTVFEGSSEDATPYAVYTNTDGTMAFFHSARREQIGGWTAVSTVSGDKFLSAAGLGTRLFVAVERSGEMLLEEWDFNYIARADGCENLTHAGTTSWTATLTHLKSATVDVFDASGNYLEQVTTDASGNFTTSASQTDIWVGHPVTWNLETLTPEIVLADGPVLGRRSMISGCTVFFISTKKVKVGETVKTFTSEYTGPHNFRIRGWEFNPTIPLTGTIAEKCLVSGLRAEIM